MDIGYTALLIAIGVVLCASGFLLRQYLLLRQQVRKQEKEANQRMYELAILKELGDRIGYSLNVDEIVDVISGSLHQFIDYSAVSYMLIEPERLLFKVHLEESVKRSFVDDIKVRMHASLEALAHDAVGKKPTDEVLSGAILIEEIETPVRSFFNIPLVINEVVVGVLTVASVKEGLYREDEMTLLYKITNQASHAVTKLQEVVRIEERKLSAMVESMSDGVVMVDENFRIVVANPVAHAIAKKDNSEAVDIFSFIDVLANRFDIRGRLEESVRQRRAFVENRVRIGEQFFDIGVLPVTAEVGERERDVLGAVVVFHDVTHAVELERMHEDFTSMLVHELRSPLDGIKNIAEVLRSKKRRPKASDYAEYLTMIYQNSFQMLSLVNDILDVAKVESGTFSVEPSPTDIREIINNRVAFFKTTAADKTLTLNACVDGTIPETVSLDGRAVSQVLNNLLSNGLKFTDTGDTISVFAFAHRKGGSIQNELETLGVSLPVSSAKLKLPEGLVLGVTDSGMGIPKDELGQLFDRFRQVSTARKRAGKKGTGLGLAIVKGITSAHGGTVSVLSEEGAGTVFFSVFPNALRVEKATTAA